MVTGHDPKGRTPLGLGPATESGIPTTVCTLVRMHCAATGILQLPHRACQIRDS